MWLSMANRWRIDRVIASLVYASSRHNDGEPRSNPEVRNANTAGTAITSQPRMARPDRGSGPAGPACCDRSATSATAIFLHTRHYAPNPASSRYPNLGIPRGHGHPAVINRAVTPTPWRPGAAVAPAPYPRPRRLPRRVWPA